MKAKDDPSSNLTVEQCEELAAALFEDAEGLGVGPEKSNLARLAEEYRRLAKMKRFVLSRVN